MLIYEKVLNNVKHLFGTRNNVPADTDQPLVYKDETGTVITPAITDVIVDGASSNSVQRIEDKTLNKKVSVYISGEATPIIGDTPAVVTTAKVTAKPVEVKAAAESKPVEVKAVTEKTETSKAETHKEENKTETK